MWGQIIGKLILFLIPLLPKFLEKLFFPDKPKPNPDLEAGVDAMETAIKTPSKEDDYEALEKLRKAKGNK